jgi:hypothetical protein
MADIQTELASTLILALAEFLMAFAVWRRSKDERRILLAAFLVLQGLSSILEGAWQLLRAFGILVPALHVANELPSILAAPTWAIVCLQAWRKEAVRWAGMAWAGCAPLLAAWTLFLPSSPPTWLAHWRLWQEAAFYTVGLAACLVIFLRQPSGPDKDRAGCAFLASAVLAIPIAAEAAALLLHAGAPFDWLVLQSLLMGGGLGLLCVIFAVHRQGLEGVRWLVLLSLLLGGVATVWLLYPLGPLQGARAGPIWSIRWVLFLLTSAVAVSSYGLWSVQGRTARWLGRGTRIFVAALVANELVGLLSAIPGITLPLALSASVVLVGIPMAAGWASRRSSFVAPAGIEWRVQAAGRTSRTRTRELHERRQPKTILLGRFELQERLSRGMERETWAAWDRWTGHGVVVKAFAPDSRDHAIQEARMALGARHQNLACVIDVQDDGAGFLMVMERIHGPTVWQLMAAGRFDAATANLVQRDMTAALDHLHALGIAHGDIKPDNIAVDRGHAVLLDFGSVRTATLAERTNDFQCLANAVRGNYATGPAGRERRFQLAKPDGTVPDPDGTNKDSN